MVEANGTQTMHEGLLILHNKHYPSNWMTQKLKYTYQVLREQMEIEAFSWQMQKVKHGDLCFKSKTRIAACKMDTMFTNQIIIIIIIILIVALPTTLMMLRIMWKSLINL